MEEDNNVIQKLTLSKEGAEDLTFVRCDSEEIPEGYVPVLLPESSKDEFKSAFSAAIGAAIPSAMVSQAANGLYRATVDPVKLATFSDGTKSTILREGNKITGHAGFEPVSPKVFAPLFIFQVLSFFTGQYYMHRISKQLEALQETINELRKDHEFKNQANLSTAYRQLKKYALSPINTLDDLVLIQQYSKEMSELYDFYLKRIGDSNDKFIEEKKKSLIWRNDLIPTETVIWESDQLAYYRRMCLDASRLYIISELVYLKALVSVSRYHEENKPKIAVVLNNLEIDKEEIIKRIYDSYLKRLCLFEGNSKSDELLLIQKGVSKVIRMSRAINLEEWRNKEENNKYRKLLKWGVSQAIGYVQNLDDECFDPVRRSKNKVYQHYQSQIDALNSEIDAILQPIKTEQDLLLSIKDGEPRLYRLEKPE